MGVNGDKVTLIPIFFVHIPSTIIFGDMMQRLPVYCVLMLTTGLAWLHLINWKYPVLDFLQAFGGRHTSPGPQPEWANLSNQIIGSFLLVIMMAVMLRLKVIKQLMIALLAIIIFLALTDFLVNFPNVQELLEYGIRYATPISLFLILNKEITHLESVLKVGILATFAGHGIYALGIPAVPANFMEMTTNITGWGHEEAVLFLFVIGILDIMAGLGLFFRKTVRFSLGYCVLWGFMTAMARVFAYTHLGFEEVFARWMPEMILRLPNSLIPLWVLTTFHNSKSQVE